MLEIDDTSSAKKTTKRTSGLDRELNPGPLAPEARIIPLDHRANEMRIMIML